jgi:transposase
MLTTVRTTVKIRIKTEVLTARKQRKLDQITGRDTRTIKYLLKVIYHNEELLTVERKGKNRVNKSTLDQLTLTTSKNTSSPPRLSVRHDVKAKFPRSSHDELQECRDNAVATYHSQQAVGTAPTNYPSLKKLPRTQAANKQRFVLSCSPANTVARWWVGIRDSLNTYKKQSGRHNRLWLPLACAPYHEHKLQQGTLQALELVYNQTKREWWAHFIIRSVQPSYHSAHPPAVLGIDLGINKRAVSALLTSKGTIRRHEIKFWLDKVQTQLLKEDEDNLTEVQRKLANLSLVSPKRRRVLTHLRALRTKHRRKRLMTDHCFVNTLIRYILRVSKSYDLYVVLGYPQHIRKSHYRGNQRPRTRKSVHQWNYRRVIDLLKFKLSLHGWADHRVLALGESWTSSICSRCGSYNTLRPNQPTFICHTCGYQLNADLNGAKNVAKRLIHYVLYPKYPSIKDVLTGDFFPLSCFRAFPVLGQWLQTKLTLGTGVSP